MRSSTLCHQQPGSGVMRIVELSGTFDKGFPRSGNQFCMLSRASMPMSSNISLVRAFQVSCKIDRITELPRFALIGLFMYDSSIRARTSTKSASSSTVITESSGMKGLKAGSRMDIFTCFIFLHSCAFDRSRLILFSFK